MLERIATDKENSRRADRGAAQTAPIGESTMSRDAIHIWIVAIDHARGVIARLT